MLPRLWINRSLPCMSMYVILLKQNILIFLVGVVFSDAHVVEDTGKHDYALISSMSAMSMPNLNPGNLFFKRPKARSMTWCFDARVMSWLVMLWSKEPGLHLICSVSLDLKFTSPCKTQASDVQTGLVESIGIMHAYKATNTDVDQFQIFPSCSLLDLCCVTASCREMFYLRSRRQRKRPCFCCFWLCIIFLRLRALSRQRSMVVSLEPRYPESKFSFLLWWLFNQLKTEDCSRSVYSICSKGRLNKYQNKFSQKDSAMFPQSFCD